MTNYDDAYVKRLEEQNEKLREQNENLISSYEIMESLFSVSSVTDLQGVTRYHVNFKANVHEISQKEYDIISRLGIEIEPVVDMRTKYGPDEPKEDLLKKIDEALDAIRSFRL